MHPLILRPVTPDDLPILFEIQRDPELNAMAEMHPRDEESFYSHWQTNTGDQSSMARVIEVDGNVVGLVSIFRCEGIDSLGYWLARAYWGNGLMTQAVKKLLQEVSIRPLHARAASSNLASCRVLEKCGFTLTGFEWCAATDRLRECEEAIYRLD